MSPEMKSAMLRAGLVPPAKVEHDGRLTKSAALPLHSHISRQAKALGWALIYCAALLVGGVIAIIWSSL